MSIGQRPLQKNKFQDMLVDSTFFMSPNSKTSMTDNKNLTDLIALKGISHISENNFSECSNLHYISFPSTLTSIGLGAFNGCQNIDRLDYGDQTNVQDLLLDTIENREIVGKTLFAGTESVGGRYQDNQELKEVNVLNNVINLAGGAFASCTKLTNVVLPNSLIHIKGSNSPFGPGTFENCQNLINTKLPDNITILDGDTFYNCPNLEFVLFPAHLEKINSRDDTYGNYFGCFRDCPKLKAVELPDAVTAIEHSSFIRCYSSVKLSSSLETIGQAAFQNCSSLTKINLPDFSNKHWEQCL